MQSPSNTKREQLSETYADESSKRQSTGNVAVLSSSSNTTVDKSSNNSTGVFMGSTGNASNSNGQRKRGPKW